MSDNLTAIECQLDLILQLVQRVDGRLSDHEGRHISEARDLSAYRQETEARLTRLETSTKTKWALVVSIGSVLVAIASQIFGLRLGAIP